MRLTIFLLLTLTFLFKMTKVISTTLGDSPKFIDIKNCGPQAKRFINSLNFEQKKIHTCRVSADLSYKTNDTITIVEIQYGDPDDCLGGCIYKRLTAIVDNDNVNVRSESFAIVPRREELFDISLFPEFNSKKNREQFSCEKIGTNNNTDRAYGKKDGRWGLYLSLQKPLICTWREVTSTEYPKDYSHSINKGFKVTGEWRGSVFLTEKLPAVVDVVFNETFREAISWEWHKK